jgi:hypothetical protein
MIELSPGHKTGNSYPLCLNVLRERQFALCERDHPQASQLTTTCVVKYNGRGRGTYTTNVTGLPDRFEASYSFPDGRVSKIFIEKSSDTGGEVSFILDPVCSVEADNIFWSIRRRNHRVTPAGQRMNILRRKAMKQRRGVPLNQVRFQPTHSRLHVCSNSCRPISHIQPELSTNIDLPLGTPDNEGQTQRLLPVQPIQPISYVGATSNTTTNDRKRRMDSDENTRSLKIQRN